MLPAVRTDSEPNHSHSAGKKQTFNFNIFANAANIASGHTEINTSRHKTTSLGPVDLEVSSFDGSFLPSSVKEILEIPSVKEHIHSSKWSIKRPVYLITGLSVAKNSFHVTEEFGTAQFGSLGASGTAPAGPVPLEAGGTIGGGRENTRVHEYDTAPGVVFSFRCHVIRKKRQLELFASREGFYTGSGDEDEDEDEQQLEIQSVTGAIMKMDLDEKVGFTEVEVDGDAWIVFTEGKEV